MRYEKIAKLVRKLHEKTIDGKLEWEQTDKRGVFQTSFPDYTIRISMQLEESGEYYYVSIYDSQGILVEQVNDVGLEGDIPDSFKLMKEMYEFARRKALGVDKALDDILSQLEEDLPF